MEKNFDRITDQEYQNILRSTLHVYVGTKPQKDEALRIIKEHYELISTIPQGAELPLFLNEI